MTSPAPKQPKKTPDWAAIEPHYRAGVRSLKEIGAEYGVSDAAIIKHARKMDWTRDLTAKIRAKAEAKVSAAAVSAEVRAANRNQESVIVEAVATNMFNVRMAHRKDIARSKNLFNVLLGELEVTSNPEGQGLIESLMDVLRTPDAGETEEQQKRRRKSQADALAKVLAIPERVDTFKRLMETQDRLVQLERQAFGITDKTPDDPNAGLPTLNDAERASRAATLLALALQRRLTSEAEKPATAPANAS